MLYFKAPGRCIHPDFTTVDWGEFVRYIQVADDQYATRQVEVFEDGSILRYERSHWCDDFGMLLGLKFSRKPKWAVFFPGAELIVGTEFENAWKLSQRSKLWKQQVDRSRVIAWGAFPVG